MNQKRLTTAIDIRPGIYAGFYVPTVTIVPKGPFTGLFPLILS